MFTEDQTMFIPTKIIWREVRAWWNLYQAAKDRCPLCVFWLHCGAPWNLPSDVLTNLTFFWCVKPFILHFTITLFNCKLNALVIKSNQMLIFEERAKTGVPGEKTVGAKKRTNKLSPLMTPSPGKSKILVDAERSYHSSNPVPHNDYATAKLGKYCNLIWATYAIVSSPKLNSLRSQNKERKIRIKHAVKPAPRAGQCFSFEWPHFYFLISFLKRNRLTVLTLAGSYRWFAANL